MEICQKKNDNYGEKSMSSNLVGEDTVAKVTQILIDMVNFVKYQPVEITVWKTQSYWHLRVEIHSAD